MLGLDPSIDCFDFKNRGLHAQLLPAGVVSLAVYPIGIFAMFSWVIISNRDVLRNHKLIRTTEELLVPAPTLPLTHPLRLKTELPTSHI